MNHVFLLCSLRLELLVLFTPLASISLDALRFQWSSRLLRSPRLPKPRDCAWGFPQAFVFLSLMLELWLVSMVLSTGIFLLLVENLLTWKKSLYSWYWKKILLKQLWEEKWPVIWNGEILIQGGLDFEFQVLLYMMDENLLIKKITFTKLLNIDADWL